MPHGRRPGKETVGAMARKRNGRYGLAAVAGLALGAGAAGAFGAGVSGGEAVRAAAAWLARTGDPMACGLSAAAGGVAGVETRTGEDGAALFHVVRLEGGGTVVLSGDTGVEPVVAFARGKLDAGAESPLGALLEGDMRRRRAELDAVASGRAVRRVAAKDAASPESKWSQLLGKAGPPRAASTNQGAVVPGPTNWPTTVETCPLVGTHWTQGLPWDSRNSPASAYLPDGGVAGCAPVAFAQILNYFGQAPELLEECRTNRFPITVVDGDETNRLAVALEWTFSDFHDWRLPWTLVDAFPEQLGKNIATVMANGTVLGGFVTNDFAGQRYVGMLLQVCGALLGAEYDVREGSTGAAVAAFAPVFREKFGFAGARASEVGGVGGMTLEAVVDTIRAEVAHWRPVALGIDGKDAEGKELRHAVVADGFGTCGETLYTHLNMGWGGLADMWYNLQGTTVDIPVGAGSAYDNVHMIVHDIRPAAWLSADDLLDQMLGMVTNMIPASMLEAMMGVYRQQAEAAAALNEPLYVETMTPHHASGTYGLTNRAITLEWRPWKAGATYRIVREEDDGTSHGASNAVVVAEATAGTAFVDATARPGVRYRYSVVRDDGTELECCRPCVIHVMAPADLRAAAADGGIAVAWSASEGAGGYQLYRAGPFATRAAAEVARLEEYQWMSGDELSFTDELAGRSGDWYKYGVRAYCPYTGLSEWCSVAPVVRAPVKAEGSGPGPVPAVEVDRVEQQVRLSWNAVPGARGYRVWPSEWFLEGNGRTTTAELQLWGERAVYRVQAVFTNGASEIGQGVEVVMAPPTPTLALERGEGTNGFPFVRVRVGGTAEAGVGETGGVVAGATYRLHRRKLPGGPDTVVAALKGNGGYNTFPDRGVWPGVLYEYWVETAPGKESARKSIRIRSDGTAAVGDSGKETELEAIAISGPGSVTSGGTVRFACLATYSDGTNGPVSGAWSILSGGTFGSIAQDGLFTAAAVEEEHQVVLRVDYEGLSATLAVRVTAAASGDGGGTGGGGGDHAGGEGETWGFLGASWVTNACSVRFAASIGKTYRLQRADVLDGEWVDVVAGTGVDDCNMSLGTLIPPGTRMGFYRLVIDSKPVP